MHKKRIEELEKQNLELVKKLNEEKFHFADKEFLAEFKEELIKEINTTKQESPTDKVMEENTNPPDSFRKLLYSVAIWGILLIAVATIIIFLIEGFMLSNPIEVDRYTISKEDAKYIADNKIPIAMEVTKVSSIPSWLSDWKISLNFFTAVATLLGLIFALIEIGKSTGLAKKQPKKKRLWRRK
ncbi:hypothetical protein [Bacillus sp. JJ722]|uniref:hypothetical protein n=1 Tax=Bacillus sp. JJ722 TaxID=3122973 RepID=UPI002FFF15EC